MNGDEEVQPKPAIIIDGNPDTGEVSAGVDIDGDGKADLSLTTVIKDWRVWAVISAAVAVGVAGNQLGFW